MSDSNARLTTRLLALAASCALAVGIAACGDSDGDSAASGDDEPASTSVAETPADTAAERKKVADTMRYIRNRYNAGDGNAFCAQLSEEGLAEVQEVIRSGQYAKYIEARECAGYVSEYSKEVVKRDGLKQRPITVLRVTVDGDKATMIMKGGLAGYRSVVPFRFVKVGDEWKLTDPITAPRRTIRVDKQ